MHSTIDYVCPKCGSRSYELGEIRATGGIVSKIFDVQTEKYTAVTCSRCKYTEFYKADSSMLGNIFDFFTD